VQVLVTVVRAQARLRTSPSPCALPLAFPATPTSAVSVRLSLSYTTPNPAATAQALASPGAPPITLGVRSPRIERNSLVPRSPRTPRSPKHVVIGFWGSKTGTSQLRAWCTSIFSICVRAWLCGISNRHGRSRAAYLLLQPPARLSPTVRFAARGLAAARAAGVPGKRLLWPTRGPAAPPAWDWDYREFGPAPGLHLDRSVHIAGLCSKLYIQ
jgi:hypothetical protein